MHTLTMPEVIVKTWRDANRYALDVFNDQPGYSLSRASLLLDGFIGYYVMRDGETKPVHKITVNPKTGIDYR